MVDEKPEGREALEDEASEGSMAPSAELEEAMREAAEAVEAREESRREPKHEAAEELAAAQAEVERLKDVQLRLQADFENHRKRALRDREEAHKFGHENLVKDLLATVDNLERAIQHARSSGTADFEAM